MIFSVIHHFLKINYDCKDKHMSILISWTSKTYNIKNIKYYTEVKQNAV